MTDTVLMVVPTSFGFNPQTYLTNPFQKNLSLKNVLQKAIGEFYAMIDTLKKEGIKVLILQSREDVETPDAVFPNNWFSSHEDGSVVLYPMLSLNRRGERQIDNLKKILNKAGMPVKQIADITRYEIEGKFLEGTGSMVLDRENKVAFAIESPRTAKAVFDIWCKKMGYEGVFFHAYDKNSVPVYHTNVLMSVGKDFSVICLESISDRQERKIVLERLERLKKEIVPITIEQMSAFCGNILQLRSIESKQKIILSASAYRAFTPEQRIRLKRHGDLVKVNIPTIEIVGGGSARCMMAEIFRAR